MNPLPLLSVLGRMSVQAAIVVVVILLVQAGFRKWLAPRWRCALWLLLFARLLLPFSPGSALSIFNLSALRFAVPEKALPALSSASPDGAAFQVEASMAPTTQNPSPALEPAGAPRPGLRDRPVPTHWFSSPRFWGGVWLAGFAGFLLQVAFRSARWRARFAGSPRVFDAPITDLVDECAKQLGLRTRLAVFESASVSSPILYGMLKPRVVLPNGFLGRFNREEVRFVILHEMVHLKSGDLILNWLTTFLQAVHWFNPLVWVGFERWRADREQACDAVVLRTVGAARKRDYGETIIQLLEDGGHRTAIPGHVGVSAAPGELRSRLAMIVAFEPASRRSALALFLVAGIGLACLTNAPSERRSSAPASLLADLRDLAPAKTAVPRDELGIPLSYKLEKTAVRSIAPTSLIGQKLVGAANPVVTATAWHDKIKLGANRSSVPAAPVVIGAEMPRTGTTDLITSLGRRDAAAAAAPSEATAAEAAEPSFAGARDISIDVVVDLTEAGRKIARPTPGQPAYYLPLTAGYKELGAFVPNQTAPANLEVQHLLARALYDQGYRVTNRSQPPSLVLVFWWGHLAPEIISPEVSGSGSHTDAFHRTSFYGSNWDAMLAELPTQQSESEKLMVSLVAGSTRDYQYATDNPNPKLERILTMERSPRHFLIMAAFDFQDWARHKTTLLWQAHVSTELADHSLGEVLPTLIRTAAPLFGRETTSPQLLAVSGPPAATATVTVGTAVVKDYPQSIRPPTNLTPYPERGSR